MRFSRGVSVLSRGLFVWLTRFAVPALDACRYRSMFQYFLKVKRERTSHLRSLRAL